MSKYVIDSATLTSIGDAVREKEGSTEAILVSDIPARILAIETGGGGGGAELPPEAFEITSNAGYRFSNNGWNWFIDAYGDKITTKDLISINCMFQYSSLLEEIPFDLNLLSKPPSSGSCNYAFAECSKLKNIPKITGRVSETNNIFSGCQSLVELSEEAIKDIDWSWVESNTSAYIASRGNTFQNCYSLRNIPMSFLAHGNPVSAYSYSIYYGLFNYCCVLDEAVNIPIQHRNATWTSNAFVNTFNYCMRLKDITFETNEDGSPIVINGWSKQTIDLTRNVGFTEAIYAYYYNLLVENGANSGITEADCVAGVSSYEEKKDSPNWFGSLAENSRYNHDSAVRTINSLPDLSGGAGGNTIKFKGASGTNTGGAINTLTDTEIAVAAAKGWTVTLS